MNNLDEEDADAWHKMSEKLIGEFTKIANLGMSEYEYMPPNKYFRDLLWMPPFLLQMNANQQKNLIRRDDEIL